MSAVPIKLTEVETCMIRTALRRIAEQDHADHPLQARDWRALADRLDPLVRAEITERLI